MNERSQGSYFDAGGLSMYYEVHGAGEPLVLLHGGLTTIDSSFERVLPAFARSRRVIAAEQQAHGHTADIDRPLDFEQMADDTAALLRSLDVGAADIFGFSDGGNVALGIAIRHPDLVRRLVVAGTNYNNDGLYPQILEGLENLTADQMPASLREAYEKTAPNPGDFPTLVRKISEQAVGFKGWPPEAIKSIAAPTLVIAGDSDIIRPEHAVGLFRLLGGGVAGDIAGLPASQLAIIPGASHTTALLEQADWLVSMITSFLDTPLGDNNGP